jgi:hypothetical protein
LCPLSSLNHSSNQSHDLMIFVPLDRMQRSGILDGISERSLAKQINSVILQASKIEIYNVLF